MNRVTGIVCTLLAALAVAVAAQAPKRISDEAYTEAMKEIGPLSQEFRKNLEGGAAAAAAGDAARLEALFADVLAYWEAREVDDAVAGSRIAFTAAASASKAIAANDMRAAANAQKTLQGTCRDCHRVYRERLPDGTYRFK